MMILELHRQGLSVTAIARRTGRDPKTVRKYIERGVEALVYGPRSVGRPSKLAPFMGFLRERVVAFPDLSAARLTREIRELPDLAQQPAPGQLGEGGDPLPQIRCERCHHTRPRLARAVGGRRKAALDVFADGLAMAVQLPGDRRDVTLR